MAEKIRVHMLAKEIGVESKAILAKCRAEGLDVKNHMSALGAGLEATIREWFSEGMHSTTLEQTERVNLESVRIRRKRKPTTTRKKGVQAKGDTAGEQGPPDGSGETAIAVAEAPEGGSAPPAEMVPAAPEPTTFPFSEEAARTDGAVAATAEAPQEVSVEKREPTAAGEVAAPQEAEAPATAVGEATAPPPAVRAPKGAPKAPEIPPKLPEEIKPAGPKNVPAPARLKGPRIVRVEAPDAVSRPIPKTVRRRPREVPAGTPEVGPQPSIRRARGAPQKEAEPKPEKGKVVKARAHPRRGLHFSETVAGERLKEWRERDLIERQERMQAASGRGLHARRAVRRATGGPRPIPTARKEKVQLTEPIILRDFCKETGIGMARLMPKLIREHNVVPNIAMVLPTELGELLALNFGIELEVIKAKSALDRLREEAQNRERENPEPRPPVVTFLGHVDHGKTSLLDAIRQTRVAEGESGGITQHIGAYRLDRDGKSVTFLDTPGHEAFTAMRARGAQMTDVVVLVVAADDGVMAQTIEAINHAKAANVPIVVALNKIDLPGADVNRAYGQLAEHDLVPQEWGGETDVIQTSAVTGEGIDELVEHLSTLSELLDLKADPGMPATGVAIEAAMKEGVGPVARVLVMEGVLRPGTVVVCGGGFGRIRSLTDDRGRRVNQADPGTPVEISGLDALPQAGDRLFEMNDLQGAKAVAQETQQERRQKSLVSTRQPRTLEDLFRERDSGQVPELNVIVRADAQGSVEVLCKTLGEITSEQAKLNILHGAAGGITEGDVVLAQASDAVIIGFHVVADPSAQRLAAEKGVDIRLYRVIYDLTDDIRKALEGMLTPETREETRGRAEVREVFRITRVGAVAGCLVVDGVVARSHYLRVIRDGRIIVPTEEDARKGEHRQVDSLRRFKDDTREVRSGLECGIRVSEFDDIKPGDVIESYEIIKIARKL